MNSLRRADRPYGRRWFRFAGGALLGVCVAVGLSFGLLIVFDDLVAGDVRLETVGADISAHGGVRLVVKRPSGIVEQTCNGACDDLLANNIGRANTLQRVEVLNAAGGCVACARGWGWPLSGTVESWRVAGVSRLTATRTLRGVPGR